MLCFRKNYTLYPRKTRKKSKKIYYVRLYSEDGLSRFSFSTGLSSKEAARAKYDALFANPEEIKRLQAEYEARKHRSKEVALYCDKKELSIKKICKYNTFEEFSEDWWDWDKCQYVLAKRSKGTEKHPGIKRSSVDTNKSWLNKYLIPILGKYRLVDITPKIIDTKLLVYLKEEVGLAPKTCNNIRAVLMTMLKEAEREGLIEKNPVELTIPFTVDEIESEILTLEEIRKLFSWENFEQNWRGCYQAYTATLLATFTGMRQGEIRALKLSDVYYSDISVTKGYSRYGENTTKTSEIRHTPIPKDLYKLLAFCDSLYPQSEYIFSVVGNKPVDGSFCRKHFYQALNAIGIDEEERKRRFLTFHSLRHFFTTFCVTQNINEFKIRSVTGHKSMAMIERYTDLRPTDQIEIKEAQDNLSTKIFR